MNLNIKSRSLVQLFLAVVIGCLLIGTVAAAPSMATRYFDRVWANRAVLDNALEDDIVLRVQGYTTQTNNLLTLEQSDGTDVLGVANNGNLTIIGNVTNSSGAHTVTDNQLIDGQADAVQLTVQGFTTQTSKLLTLEQSDGTDKLTVDNNGLLLDATTELTLTVAGEIVTPTTRSLILDSTGAISMVLGACANNGQPLQLYGRDANTITVNDTNIRTTTGAAITMTQYDLAEWECHDTEWILRGISANE